MDEIRNAGDKVGRLLIATGFKLKRLANSKNEPTLTDLDDIRETLIYCVEALSKIADALSEEASREKHGS